MFVNLYYTKQRPKRKNCSVFGAEKARRQQEQNNKTLESRVHYLIKEDQAQIRKINETRQRAEQLTELKLLKYQMGSQLEQHRYLTEQKKNQNNETFKQQNLEKQIRMRSILDNQYFERVANRDNIKYESAINHQKQQAYLQDVAQRNQNIINKVKSYEKDATLSVNNFWKSKIRKQQAHLNDIYDKNIHIKNEKVKKMLDLEKLEEHLLEKLTRTQAVQNQLATQYNSMVNLKPKQFFGEFSMHNKLNLSASLNRSTSSSQMNLYTTQSRVFDHFNQKELNYPSIPE